VPHNGSAPVLPAFLITLQKAGNRKQAISRRITFRLRGFAQPEKRWYSQPFSFSRLRTKSRFRASTPDEKTGMESSETNCVRGCTFYLSNWQVQRKDTVEIRKIIDSNDDVDE
jgi:hypothetical protein